STKADPQAFQQSMTLKPIPHFISELFPPGPAHFRGLEEGLNSRRRVKSIKTRNGRLNLGSAGEQPFQLLEVSENVSLPFQFGQKSTNFGDIILEVRDCLAERQHRLRSCLLDLRSPATPLALRCIANARVVLHQCLLELAET